MTKRSFNSHPTGRTATSARHRACLNKTGQAQPMNTILNIEHVTRDAEGAAAHIQPPVNLESPNLASPASPPLPAPGADFSIYAASIMNEATGAGAYTFKVRAGAKSFEISDYQKRLTKLDLNLSMIQMALSLTGNIPGSVTIFTPATPETDAIRDGSLAKLAAGDYRDPDGEFIEEFHLWESFYYDWLEFGPE